MPEVVVNVLNEDGSAKTPEQVEGERQSIIAQGDTPIVPGSATDHGLLLKSLQDEREKRRALEEELESLKGSPTDSDILTEEGKALQKQIQESKSQIDTLTKDLAKKDVLITHPILKEKWEEFESFLADPENKGMNIKTAAKSFLVENGLLDAPRIGLEKPTGGDRVPTPTKMSAEEIKVLRETNFRLYQKLLEEGKIKV